jgi:hypothetical protein
VAQGGWANLHRRARPGVHDLWRGMTYGASAHVIHPLGCASSSLALSSCSDMRRRGLLRPCDASDLRTGDIPVPTGLVQRLSHIKTRELP